MGARKCNSSAVTPYNSTSGMTLWSSSGAPTNGQTAQNSNQSSDTPYNAYYNQVAQKKQNADSLLVEVCEAPNEGAEKIKEAMKGGSSCKDDEPIQKKKFPTTLPTIQEDIFNRDSQAVERKKGCSGENIHVVKGGSSCTNVQLTQKIKPPTTLQAIQEDISNENSQALEGGEGSSHENISVVEEKFSHMKDQSVRAREKCEKCKKIETKQSEENYQDEEKASSNESIQTALERSFYRNDQLMQEKSSHENDQTTQEKSLSGEVKITGEAPSHENAQAVEEFSQEYDYDEQKKSLHENVQIMVQGSSCKNDQSIQEESFLENDQMTQKKSFSDEALIGDEESSHENVQAVEEFSEENDHDKQEKSSHENVRTMNDESSCRNNQSAQEIEPSYENDQTAQENPSHRNVENIEDRTSYIYDQEESFQENGGRCAWVRKISVEPTMWFYMMAFMFTSVVEQAFFVHKACRVDHGQPEEICLHLNDYKDIKTEVQKTVSEFYQWYNIAGHVVPIILALFFGNWSDRRGRKLPLIIGLTGKLIYSLMIVVNSQMENWNLNMVTYTAVIPMAILGADVIIFGSCFAYLTDICSLEERTVRITILDVVYLSTMPTGIALGSYVFNNVVNSSYTIMFTINSCLLVLAIIYSFVALKWQSSREQQSLVGVNFFKDFFDIKHVKETVHTMIKWRPDSRRMCLILVMLSMCLYTFQREERSMSFLYTQLIFNWDVSKFSDFRTVQSSLFVAAMLCATPMMKYLKLKDTAIIIIGAVSHATGRLIFIMAHTGEVFYGGAVVAALGPVVAPALRSMASKFVSVEERGKVFAILSVFDNAVPLISSVLYSQVYNATIYTVPNFIYWLTFITQICVILLAIVIKFTSWSVRTVACRDNETLEST